MTDRGGFAAIEACVHCGFCLQACPTFLATGDEADSPRGRIELMRALEAGELAPDDPALALHLDRCLGCRGCEPVCPSGVGYGRGLAAARALIDRKSTRLNSSHRCISYAVFCLKKKKRQGARELVRGRDELVRSTADVRRRDGR